MAAYHKEPESMRTLSAGVNSYSALFLFGRGGSECCPSSQFLLECDHSGAVCTEASPTTRSEADNNERRGAQATSQLGYFITGNRLIGAQDPERNGTRRSQSAEVIRAQKKLGEPSLRRGESWSGPLPAQELWIHVLRKRHYLIRRMRLIRDKTQWKCELRVSGYVTD